MGLAALIVFPHVTPVPCALACMCLCRWSQPSHAETELVETYRSLGIDGPITEQCVGFGYFPHCLNACRSCLWGARLECARVIRISHIDQTDQEGRVVRRWVLGDNEEAFVPVSATNSSDANPSGADDSIVHLEEVRACFIVWGGCLFHPTRLLRGCPGSRTGVWDVGVAQCQVCEAFPINGTKFTCEAATNCGMVLCTKCYREDLHEMSARCSLQHPFQASRCDGSQCVPACRSSILTPPPGLASACRNPRTKIAVRKTALGQDSWAAPSSTVRAVPQWLIVQWGEGLQRRTAVRVRAPCDSPPSSHTHTHTHTHTQHMHTHTFMHIHAASHHSSLCRVLEFLHTVDMSCVVCLVLRWALLLGRA